MERADCASISATTVQTVTSDLMFPSLDLVAKD
jgi:hypothetical protein